MTSRRRTLWRPAATMAAAALTLVVVAGAALMAAGCGEKASLDGTTWRLTGWSVDAIDPNDFTITALFDAGQLSGTAAVNTYGATYETGADGALKIGPVRSTKMAGPEPAMEAEAVYIELLQQVRAYRLDGEQLKLLDGDGNELLLFAPARE